MTAQRNILAATLMGAALIAAPMLAPTAASAQTQAVAHADYRVKPGVTLNARSGPGTGYRAVTAYAPGTPLTALGHSGGWVKVSAHGAAPLWVSGSYLDPVTQSAPQPEGLLVVPQAKPDPSKPAFEGQYPLVVRPQS
ncbi:SH3 domain-containing protein [Celeribacter sp. PS-C1]|uniref:SH3 domain-containing protein n=1 Tax=Celeribacter sp. PS-C1 TaxID=2820813 RepID=UPI001CA5A2FC|nr:SH3 domain-containing protein [Celeribacter sp. PS-C1]MBW6419538.1 SH3 domain-containing protein [Celeribacter sp. PS-C1]